MFELDVQVKVRLTSGAEITLNDEQQKNIKNYVVELVLGAPKEIAKRTYTKKMKLGLRRWTAAEDKIITDIAKRFSNLASHEVSRDRQKAFINAQREIRPSRTISAIAARYYAVVEKLKQEEIDTVSSWNPVSLRNTN
jgi:hypothetical protein